MMYTCFFDSFYSHSYKPSFLHVHHQQIRLYIVKVLKCILDYVFGIIFVSAIIISNFKYHICIFRYKFFVLFAFSTAFLLVALKDLSNNITIQERIISHLFFCRVVACLFIMFPGLVLFSNLYYVIFLLLIWEFSKEKFQACFYFTYR